MGTAAGPTGSGCGAVDWPTAYYTKIRREHHRALTTAGDGRRQVADITSRQPAKRCVSNRDRLPTLLAGLGRHTNWETLLPAVFGISTAEFEAGWQAYLTAHYGIEVAQSRLQR